ncbi:MAG: hypothetical protein V1736_03735 [Pseudomonadota bacterium]
MIERRTSMCRIFLIRCLGYLIVVPLFSNSTLTHATIKQNLLSKENDSYRMLFAPARKVFSPQSVQRTQKEKPILCVSTDANKSNVPRSPDFKTTQTNTKCRTLEALAKVVTPVKNGVQEHPNLLEITGFQLEFTPCLIRGRNDENAGYKTFARG